MTSGAEARPERPGDLLPHLEAARPDSRADRRRLAPAERRSAGLDDPGQEAAPADVEHGCARALAALANEGERQAVGAEGDQRQRRFLRPEPVARPAALARGCTMHDC